VPENVHTKWLTLAEAAAYMRCSPRFLQEMVANKRIAHSSFAGKVLFHQDNLDALLFQHQVPVKPEDEAKKPDDDVAGKEAFEIVPDCDLARVNALIEELIQRKERFVSGLGENLKEDLERREYKTLSFKVYAQLSRWCWPNRDSSRERWVQPRVHELSRLLFGRVIERTSHPSYAR